MKSEHRPRRWNMRFVFSLLVMVELLFVVVLSWVLALVAHMFFSVTIKVPTILWLMLISLLVGGAINTFLSKQFFSPVMKLIDAMSLVSKGNFDIQLEEEHPFEEINKLYVNFNLMVRELRSTEILQTDFVSNVSHEFKTPINAIEGYAMLLQDEENSTPKEREQYVDRILCNTQRLSKLVGNVLLLSKLDHQAILSNQAVFRLDEQIRQTIVILETMWTRKEIEFDVNMEDVTFCCNESILSHVWSNLLTNAIKFSPEGGIIRISLHENGEQIIFVIEDQGPGIREDVIRHIFDKFYQGDSSHREEGNGLGLALVKQVLDTYGGTITAENREEGGSRFTVTLSRSQP